VLVALELPVPTSRPAWNGYLKFSFVSCPIGLYPATSAAERLSFRQVNRRTGHRLKHKLVDAITGEEVDASQKGRGYEVAADEYLLLEDSDIERARNERLRPGDLELASRPASSHHESPPTAPGEPQGDEDKAGDGDEEEVKPPRPINTRVIEIDRFIPVRQVDSVYFEKPYYIVPRGEVSQEAFAVIRDAMAHEKAAGLARIVLSSRERPFLVEPSGKGLRGMALRFFQDVRQDQEFFHTIPSIKLPAEMVRLAQHIVRSNSGAFDPAMLTDHYRSSLRRIIQSKQAKPATALTASPSRENVINLMDALKRSIAAQETSKKPAGVRPIARKRQKRETTKSKRLVR
jgi:DNA end-binding protein Ku